MTTSLQIRSLGKRLMALRKEQGFRTAKDLAEAIAGNRITEAVIQNIESGRKGDLSVSQLLEISAALDVSPMYLLVPVGLPYATVDLAAAGPAVASMTVAEFQEWISPDDGTYSDSALENTLRIYRRKVRRIVELDRRRQRARERLRDETLDPSGDDMYLQMLEGTIESSETEIAELRASLAAVGMDVSWLGETDRTAGSEDRPEAVG